MKTLASSLHPALAVLTGALTVGASILALSGPPALAAVPQATQVLLPEGLYIDRPRGLTTASQFNDDLALQQVASDVADYCATMAGPVPVLADLMSHLEPLYDYVWDATAATVKYKDVVNEVGGIEKICFLEHTVFVKNEGEVEPATVTYCSTTIL